MTSLFASFSPTAREMPEKRMLTSSTITVSQDARVQPGLVQEVLRQLDEERRERMVAVEGVLGRLDRQQTLITQISESQVGGNVIKAAAQEKKEMLSAIATIHGEVEALRHMILALQSGRDGANKSKFVAFESDFASIRSRLDEHQRRQDELYQLLSTQTHTTREVVVAPPQPAGASMEALEALEAAFARNCDERDRHAASLKARIDEVDLRHAELTDGHRQVVSGHAELRDKHTQVASELAEVRARQEEHSRQLVVHKGAFHARTDSTAGSLRQELAAQREEWRAALTAEVRSLRQEVSAFKQGHAVAIGEQVEEEGKRLEALHQKALRDIQLEKGSQAPAEPIDLKAIEVAVDATKVEVKKLLDAERAMRKQGDADEREARRQESRDVERRLASLSGKVEQLERRPADASAASPGSGGRDEARQLAQLQDSLAKFKAATEYELTTMRGWHASLEDEIRGLATRSPSPTRDRSPQRSSELQRQLDVLSKRLQQQQSEITALMESKQGELQLSLRSQGKLIADAKASAEDHGSKAESALVLVRKLQADLAAETAKRSQDVEEVNRLLAQERAGKAGGRRGEAWPDVFEAEEVAKMVQAEMGRRMSTSQESVNALVDQSSSKASEAAKACHDLKLHVNVQIEDLTRAVRQEEDVRARAVAGVRQLVTESVDEEKRLRARQDAELRKQLEQEVRDRIMDNTEQRQAMVKAMKEWHRKRMSSAGGSDFDESDDEDFECVALGKTKAEPSRSSWFGSWGRSS